MSVPCVPLLVDVAGAVVKEMIVWSPVFVPLLVPLNVPFWVASVPRPSAVLAAVADVDPVPPTETGSGLFGCANSSPIKTVSVIAVTRYMVVPDFGTPGIPVSQVMNGQFTPWTPFPVTLNVTVFPRTTFEN